MNSAPDYVSILAKVKGSLPLSFHCHLPFPVAHGSTDEAEGSTRHVCLSIQRLLSEHDNTVTLPDTSGTVITSANLPNPLVSNDKFTFSADVLVVNAEEDVWVGTLFVPPQRHGTNTAREYVRKYGLLRIHRLSAAATRACAGIAGFLLWCSLAVIARSEEADRQRQPDGRDSSRWSNLSNRSHSFQTHAWLCPQAWCILLVLSIGQKPQSKNIECRHTNCGRQLDASRPHLYLAVQIWDECSTRSRPPRRSWCEARWRRGAGASCWPYGAGLWEAFEAGSDRRRVDTIDSDGITLDAVQGAAHKQRRASSASDALRARIKELKAALHAQERQLAVQAEKLHSHARRIGLLQGRLAGPPSPVTPRSFGLFAKAL